VLPTCGSVDLDQLARALDAFAAHEPTHLYLHHVQVFLEVVRHGKRTFEEITDTLKVSTASVSRIAASLSDTHRKGHPGLGLVEIHKDPKEGRRYLLMLSPKGEALARNLRNLK
jgi:DNA-binding MarR family transcriptional regulator